MMNLLYTLKPRWWFSAHLHCRFEATVTHEVQGGPRANEAVESAEKTNPDEINIEDNDDTEEIPAATSIEGAGIPSRNADEIVLDDEEEDVDAPPPPLPPPAETQFLALDKCLPRRQFLEVRHTKRASLRKGTDIAAVGYRCRYTTFHTSTRSQRRSLLRS